MGFGIGEGWPIMVAFWGAIALALVAALRWLNSGGQASGLNPDSTLDTLRRSYARGEIRRDEYEQLKRDLSD
ncbi:MAG: SHOCT domain-containing protein [Pseudomonadota bacterium]